MKLIRRLDYWLNRRRYEAELAEELEFHRSQSGAPDFGNATLAREDARAVWIWPWLESVFQDLRYALRNLRKQPGFALLAILSLGVAIGLNTSFYAVVDAAALRLWTVQDPARVMKVFTRSRNGNSGFSIAEYRYFKDHAKSFSGVVGMERAFVRLGFEGFRKSSHVVFVSGDYFQVLGVPLQLGRGFLPSEDALDEPQNVAVLSYATWRDHYGSDREILGKRIYFDDKPFIVVGVAAEEFLGTTGDREDAWAPLPSMQLMMPNDADTRAFLRSPQSCCSSVAGRLAPGVTESVAQAELAVLGQQFHQEFKLPEERILLARGTFLGGTPKASKFLGAFAFLFVAIMGVLLLACANIGNLLLARAVARRQEIEIRRSLGADRARIVRQLLTEGMVLALAAAAIGVAVAWKLPGVIFALAEDVPPFPVTLDSSVVIYAIAMAAFACLAFALAPALHGTRPYGAPSRLPLRNILLAAQVAMSVVLLVVAGLMIASVEHARNLDPGYRVADTTVISFDVPASSYDDKRSTRFSNQLVKDIASVRGIPFAIADREPLPHSHWYGRFRLPGETEAQAHSIEMHEIGGGYFDLLGLPIVQGRDLQPGDIARHAIVVNEAMARRYFENQNPLGKAIIIGKQSWEIAGVARDAYLTYLDSIAPQVFQPFSGDVIPTLLVRSGAPGVIDLATGIAKQIDDKVLVQSTPLSRNLDLMLAGSSTMAGLAGVLGAFALLLAVIGMSGVFAYVVKQRTREIGIRMALGAEPRQVIRLVLSGATRAALIGLGVGYLASMGAAKLLDEYLYGVSPYDPRAYAAVAIVLSISGTAAAYFPARRATRIDPLNALRVE